MLLEGKTALVTGVGPGMGRDISLGLAKEGANLVLVARSDKVMPSVAEEARAMGREVVTVNASITDEAGVNEVREAVEGFCDHGALDILVNSAFHGGEFSHFADADLERWMRPMKINYLGTLQFTQALLPALRKAGELHGDARIIMINTMSTQHLEESHGSYAGSKAALGAVTKTLALELGKDNIRVNSVHPGYIWGDSVKIYFQMQAEERGGDTTWEDIYKERAEETALKYLPHSEEIAGSVVFFASPLARCVTGTALPVNAGHWMRPSA